MEDKQIIEQTLKENFPVLYEAPLREEILEHAVSRTFHKGEQIMDYGQYIQSFPLLLEGSIKILRQDEDGRDLLLYYLRPGDTCAMALTCCLTQQRSEVKAIAEEDSEVIFVPVVYLELWLSKYPSWKEFVMGIYRRRFQDLLDTIDSIAFKKMDERIVDYLHTKYHHHGNKTLNITHQQIADELYSTREVISRLLKQLEKQNRITLGRNKITLLPEFFKL